MTFQEFVKKNTGKKLDFDGYYENQCVDLYRFYLRDVWKVPQTSAVKGAYQIFNSLPNTFDKFTSGEIKPGDVMIWNEKQVKHGHVAVVEIAEPTRMKVFQQNAPYDYAPANSAWYPYKNLAGWFRLKPQLKTTFMQITVVANKNNWTTDKHLYQLNDFFKLYSEGKLEVVGDIRHTDYSNIPLAPFNELKSIDVGWYRKNVTPFSTGQISVFLMNPDDYPNGATWGFMTYGDPGKAVRVEVASGDVTAPNGVPLFVTQVFHEICHALFFLTGQQDRVHEFLNRADPQYKALLDLLDYQKLQQALIKIKPTLMNQTKLVLSKDGKTVYEAKPIAISFEEYKKQAGVEGIFIPNPIPKADTL